jgi:hypothetical protein
MQLRGNFSRRLLFSLPNELGGRLGEVSSGKSALRKIREFYWSIPDPEDAFDSDYLAWAFLVRLKGRVLTIAIR